MEKKKLFNIISLVVNAFIFVSTFIIVLMGVSTGAEDYQPGSEAMYGLGYLKAFTNLSNILLSFCAFVVMIFNIDNLFKNETNIPRWALIFYYIGTISTTVTFLTVVFFLGPMFEIKLGTGGYFYMFSSTMFFFHFFNPVLAILSFIFLYETDKPLDLKHNIIGMSSTVIYSIIYMSCVLSNTWTDFYGFTFGYKMFMIPISLVVMYALTFGIGFALRKINQKISIK